MRSLLAVEYNFATKIWKFNSIVPHVNSFINLSMMFRGETDVVYYDNLKFGCSLWDEDLNVQVDVEHSWPIDSGIKYVCTSSDQQYVECGRFHTEKNKNYKVKVWVENAGERSDSEHVFSTFFENVSIRSLPPFVYGGHEPAPGTIFIQPNLTV